MNDKDQGLGSSPKLPVEDLFDEIDIPQADFASEGTMTDEPPAEFMQALKKLPRQNPFPDASESTTKLLTDQTTPDEEAEIASAMAELHKNREERNASNPGMSMR